jgi:hypothetical protein
MMTDSTSSRLRLDARVPFPRRDRSPAGGRSPTARPPVRRPASSELAHYRERPWRHATPLIFGAALTATLVAGWLNRNEGHLTPGNGLGYWLGILGASAMLLLLLYPLRKRMRAGSLLGSVAFWFRLHMVLGLIGPTLILFHANFALGSANSNVALAAMLIVAGSGVVGRYLYGKFHRGLYGRKLELREILADLHSFRDELWEGLPGAARAAEDLNAFTKDVIEPKRGVIASLWSIPVVAWRTRIMRRRLLVQVQRVIASEGKRRGWTWRDRRRRGKAATELVALYLGAVKKAAAFGFYERLFALWHLLHLPLFVLLAFAAVIHVVAVHFY